MITFRFYLVTLVAIFLSVALGVVIGSTFLEPALVQDLNNQVSSVRENLDERVALIDDLNGQIGDLEQYVEGSAPFAVERTLDGEVVLVVANEGIDDAPVERLVSRLRQAGATVDGIVWVQPSFGSGDDLDEVLTALGVEVDPTDAEAVRDGAWSATMTQLRAAVEPLADGGPPLDPDTTDPSLPLDGAGTADDGHATTTGAVDATAIEEAPTTSTEAEPTTTSAPPVPTAPTTAAPTAPVTELFPAGPLQVLADAGWIRLQGIEAPAPLSPTEVPDVAPSLSVVMVTGSRAEEGTPTGLEVARRQAAAAVPTVIADVWQESEDDAAERGVTLQAVRDDAELAARISTVDDLDRVQGQVAVALAVRDLGRGVVGHYGYGAGAETVLPPWLGP